jgi:DNA mismatch repair protein MutS
MNEMTKNNATPLMRQYFEIKEQYPDTLLMFQVGDFYELFFDDAKTAAAFLGITLTARGKNSGEDIPLCGVPVHALDYYLVKLVKGGFRIAICDQLEEPKPGKVVRRGVTNVLTPGTLTDTQLLDQKSASYLLSFFPLENHWGLIFGELLTAQLFATVISANQYQVLEGELVRFFPDEIIFPEFAEAKKISTHVSRMGYCTTQHAVFEHDYDQFSDWIVRQFKSELVASLLQNDVLNKSLALLYSYLKKNQEASLEQFKQMHFYKPEDFLILDRSTQRHLEIVKNNQDGTTKNTLFEVVDGAVTAMGSRMIKKWLARPLVKKEAILQRQEIVTAFLEHHTIRSALREKLLEIGDVERVVGRIALNRGILNDYLALLSAIELLPLVHQQIVQLQDFSLIRLIVHSFGNFKELHQLLKASLNDDSGKDWIIKSGFDQKLDYVRDLIEQSNDRIIALERSEQEKTGISSLKIRYNQVHGYYIEITKTNLGLVPEHYIRHQTLVGKERFTTRELKELEREIMAARSEIEHLESEIFAQIKKQVAEYISPLRKTAQSLAHLDALLGFSLIAYENGFTKPEFNDSQDIIIQQGRHPVVSRISADRFIPNDTRLTTDQSFWIITGPNMGGKSTYLRQVALLCIMAQCGSFIPAQCAQLSLLDRIFTRIGASDNVAEGKSTFLVEMEETASICRQATQNSLIILDEVGRGTSTFDGLAIAQAVVEYLFEHVRARCLFATHYHELTQLSVPFPGIVNYYAVSKKVGDRMVLLYRIEPGIADGSFGVEVAKIAQLPEEIISRSTVLIQQLKKTTVDRAILPATDQSVLLNENARLRFELEKQTKRAEEFSFIGATIENISIDDLSPKKALDILWQIKEHQSKKESARD